MSGPQIPDKPSKDIDEVLREFLRNQNLFVFATEDGKINILKRQLDENGYVIISKHDLFWEGVNH